MQRTLHDFSPQALRALLLERGQPGYRGSQLALGLFQRGVASLDEVTDLPRSLREDLQREYGLAQMREVGRDAAPDGTTKYLFALRDRARIESVAIPWGVSRVTFCVSSQVGCRLACVFCATGKMGLVRQLSSGEIVAQVIELRRRHPSPQHPNLVFMGMGEPLDNFDELAMALQTLTDPQGLRLSARRITVSTSGLVGGIQALAALGRPYGLAVSITTGDEAQRRQLMPVAGQTPLDELLNVAAGYGRRTRRKVTLECALIAGENDGLEHAHRLLALARRGPFKVNLIPLNPIEQFRGQRPGRDAVSAFADVLWQGGVVATVRDSAGRDVSGACGQLLHRQRRPRPVAE